MPRSDTLVPRSPKLRQWLRPDYSPGEIASLQEILAPALRIELNPLGHVCAASRTTEGQDPTHYDAVWVRDSVWAYFAFQLTDARTAKRVLLNLLDYFSSPPQLQRLEAIIENPARAAQPDGAMQVLHIRFDGQSSEYRDVQVAGRDQQWNHKQNDAIGLFSLAFGEALFHQQIEPQEIPSAGWSFLLRLPTYWARLGFDSMADAGAWEEIERINTSSVAIVTRSLEVWEALLGVPGWQNTFQKQASILDLGPSPVFFTGMKALIERGYARVNRQLPFESPDYPKTSAQYRQADAALLNLIYPAKLDRIPEEGLRAVLRTVESLVGEVGVRRYQGDAYQSAGYWVPKEEEEDSRTADHSSEEAFASRAGRFVPGTEAQWFFDSWISQCYGILYKKTGSPADRQKQIQFWHRALCQVTGPQEIGADGKPVPEFALPESYNTVLEGTHRRFVPSPITPLNWAKACMALALDAL